MSDPAAIPKLRAVIAEIEARKPLSRAEGLFVLIRQAGRPVLCGCGCDEPLDPLGEGVQDEHERALGLVGGNELENRSWWRRPCSKAKDKLDVGRIAKAKRQSKCVAPSEPSDHPIPQRVNPWPPRGTRKLSGRGFEKRRSPQT